MMCNNTRLCSYARLYLSCNLLDIAGASRLSLVFYTTP
ncbi:MAG: hypothetical protein J07HN4v3_00414, partial [Halonotius sp. J07HN4]